MRLFDRTERVDGSLWFVSTGTHRALIYATATALTHTMNRSVSVGAACRVATLDRPQATASPISSTTPRVSWSCSSTEFRTISACS